MSLPEPVDNRLVWVGPGLCTRCSCFASWFFKGLGIGEVLNEYSSDGLTHQASGHVGGTFHFAFIHQLYLACDTRNYAYKVGNADHGPIYAFAYRSALCSAHQIFICSNSEASADTAFLVHIFT